MKISFFPHQDEAIEKLRSGCILCGGVGSGKSRASLGYFIRKICESDKNCINIKKPTNLLIITTAKKRDEKEWNKECSVFHLSTNKEESIENIEVTIDSWNNIKKYIAIKDSFIIFDEQKVVGSGAWVKAFLEITKNNKWILLTATPGDSWMDYIPVFVANGYYKNKSSFLREHAVYSRYSKWPKIDKWVGTKRLEYYRKSILIEMPFAKKTIKKDIIINAEYNKNLFNVIVKNRWNPYENYPITSSSEFYMLMRKVVNSDPSRLEEVIKIQKKHKRIIVFYSFDYELEILKTIKGVTIAEWNGHKHEPIPDCDEWVYLVNYMSGAEGWECIKTDTMVFYSQQYSYKIAIQSAGRIDRLNTPYLYLYYYWIRSKSWIDVSIARALSQKRDFNESKDGYNIDFTSQKKHVV